MRTLILGGSFNPIHHGHLICARAVAEVKGFERVMLMPSAQPPHKLMSTALAATEHRLRMTQISAEADQSGLFLTSDMEVQRVGASYTFDTVQALKAQGWREVNWLIGADMLNYLPKWHRAEALLAEVNFQIVARPGWVFDWAGMPEAFRHLEKNVVSAPLINISATDIRSRIAAGRSIDFLTPAGVVDYIRENQLYRETES